ncbi:MAG: ABC transporter ATP-binding protein [Trueperaceae bacterium]
MTAAPALKIAGLSVSYGNGSGQRTVLRDIDLTIETGQFYGLVGESGSGKSTLALAAMRYLGADGRITGGSIELGGVNLLAMSDPELRRTWREAVKLVPQDPLASLNPRLRIGQQIAEGFDRRDARSEERVLELLASVGLADGLRVARSFPHQLSGGMQQRVMIAAALAGSPELLILDEPTTNLDVTTEATILDLVRDLVRARDTAVLYVSHSLGVIARLCDRVAVLYAGELVEDAPVSDIYQRPLHPYTRGLLDSVPRLGQNRRDDLLRPIVGQIPQANSLPDGCVFAPRCPVATELTREQRPPLEEVGGSRRVRCHRWREIADGRLNPRQQGTAAAPAEQQPASARDEHVLTVTGLEKRYPLRRSLGDLLAGRSRRQVHAVAGVDLAIGRLRTLGLVGESGSGKSTVARCVIGLTPPSAGEVTLLDVPLARQLSARDRPVLRRLQMVFQNADEALNPYLTVGRSLRRPLARLAGVSPAEIDARLAQLLQAVRLSPDYAERYPHELSGGEKQRIAIARAFAASPDLLLFDESVSGLDVSVQAAVLNLLGQLQQERATAYLFISHDLAVVSYLADDIAVVYLGQLMETAPASVVLQPPFHPYTEALLSALPLLDPQAKQDRIRLDGELPSPVDRPGGCPFHTRCPRFLGDICVSEEPPWRETSEGKRIYCHIPLDELEATQSPATLPAAPWEGPEAND